MSGNKPSLCQSQVEFGDVLWSPSRERIASSRMLAFSRLASERNGRDLSRWVLDTTITAQKTYYQLGEIGKAVE